MSQGDIKHHGGEFRFIDQRMCLLAVAKFCNAKVARPEKIASFQFQSKNLVQFVVAARVYPSVAT